MKQKKEYHEPTKKEKALTLKLQEIVNGDTNIVGGKSASLGEMLSNLSKKGIIIPEGFCTTSKFYFEFLKETGMDDFIKQTIRDLEPNNVSEIEKRGYKIRRAIIDSDMPEKLEKEILLQMDEMTENYGMNVPVAVRSSATVEDTQDASFAGQQDTYLNIRGENEVLRHIRKCIASLFNNRAISYRIRKNFDHFKIALCVIVQRMVKSIVSGVAFSIDPDTGNRDFIIINSIYGLGEYAVGGRVNPDEFIISKKALKEGHYSIVGKKLGTKRVQLVYSSNFSKKVEEVEVPTEMQKIFTISEEEAIKLANQIMIISEHYGDNRDVEWAFGPWTDPKTGILHHRILQIVQARPETIHSVRQNVIEEYRVTNKENARVLLCGAAVGNRAGSGTVKHVRVDERGNIKILMKTKGQSVAEFGPDAFEVGDVLVAEFTTPDLEPLMKKASAIVTDRGGRTCHAAIISREIGVPCVVGTGNCTKILRPGTEVTVSASEGEVGKIYAGKLNIEIDKLNVERLPQTNTKVQLIVGDPEEILKNATIPNDGVALLREEFIANIIGIHPCAILDYQKINAEKNERGLQIREYSKLAMKKVMTLIEGLLDQSAISWLITAQNHLRNIQNSMSSTDSFNLFDIRSVRESFDLIKKILKHDSMATTEGMDINILSNAIKDVDIALSSAERIEKMETILNGDPSQMIAGINEKSAGHPDIKEWYLETLAQGLAKIAHAFPGKSVKLRTSDFKSNEYKKLIGGWMYETTNEENPMMGWRGLSRYYDSKFKGAFRLEIDAIRRAREKYGATNIEVFFPIVRTEEELIEVLKLMKHFGLERGKDGLKVGIMVEVPATAILAERFIRYVDFISFGTNDLVQFTLSIDRDSGLSVIGQADEMNPAVLYLIEKTISECKKSGVETGICGQGPSDKTVFARKLIELGIDTIGVQPDVAIKTRLIVAKIEGKKIDTVYEDYLKKITDEDFIKSL